MKREVLQKREVRQELAVEREVLQEREVRQELATQVQELLGPVAKYQQAPPGPLLRLLSQKPRKLEMWVGARPHQAEDRLRSLLPKALPSLQPFLQNYPLQHRHPRAEEKDPRWEYLLSGKQERRDNLRQRN